MEKNSTVKFGNQIERMALTNGSSTFQPGSTEAMTMVPQRRLTRESGEGSKEKEDPDQVCELPTSNRVASYVPRTSPVFKLLENINSYSNSFEILDLLGRGGFGSVHKVKHILDQQYYALKRIKIHLGAKEDI